MRLVAEMEKIKKSYPRTSLGTGFICSNTCRSHSDASAHTKLIQTQLSLSVYLCCKENVQLQLQTIFK